MLYTKIIRPIFFKLDPEKIHHLAVIFLQWLAFLSPLSFLIKKYCFSNDPRLSMALGNLKLQNPIGLPAGFDKFIEAPKAYEMLGFGFAELGSITYSPLAGNPKPRLWRIPQDKGLIVYYGLANCGAKMALKKISKYHRRGIPWGISIAPTTGLNLAEMAEDYLKTFSLLAPAADYVVLNVSCPNVASCDVFFQVSFIQELISGVSAFMKEKCVKKDIFVKIGPDLKPEEIDVIVDACLENNFTGIIATNLIKNRTGVVFKSPLEATSHPGGVSGRLLKEKSNEVIKRIYLRSQGKLRIIGLGGVFTAEDAYEKIKCGASAVQMFTGFIYEGPLVVRKINQDLIKLFKKDGFNNINEAVGKAVAGMTDLRPEFVPASYS